MQTTQLPNFVAEPSDQTRRRGHSSLVVATIVTVSFQRSFPAEKIPQKLIQKPVLAPKPIMGLCVGRKAH
jgi:hypothetical protein